MFWLAVGCWATGTALIPFVPRNRDKVTWALVSAFAFASMWVVSFVGAL